MQPKFEKMTNQELRAYALAHREDVEALDVLYSRRTPDSEALWFHPPKTQEEERSQFELFKQMIEERAGKTDNNYPVTTVMQPENNLITLDTEIEARLLQKIAAENRQSARQATATVTPEKIDRAREELKDYPEALAAIDTIQECGGNLENAARLIAIAAGIEVESEFLEKLSSRCRNVICQDGVTAELAGMISAIAEFLVSNSDLPSRLATPIALFAIEKGIEDFCDL